MKIFIDENIEERYAQGLYEDYLKEQIEQKDKEIKRLQARIDKAIEYINEHLEVTEYGEVILKHTFDKHNLKELKDILGSDKEWKKKN